MKLYDWNEMPAVWWNLSTGSEGSQDWMRPYHTRQNRAHNNRRAAEIFNEPVNGFQMKRLKLHLQYRIVVIGRVVFLFFLFRLLFL